MPELELTSPEIKAIQRILRDNGYEAPEKGSWADEDDPRTDPEGYPHYIANDRGLYRVLNACPVCGDPECNRGTALVGATIIHADKHPENQRGKWDARTRRH